MFVYDSQCMCACVRSRACNQHIAGLLDLKEVKGEGCLLVPHTSVNNTQEPLSSWQHFFILCCCVIAEHMLTEPFSITLLSMMTALVFCSQIMSQKWPHVFLRGPCRQCTCTPSSQTLGGTEGKTHLSLTTAIMIHNKITVKFPKESPKKSLIGGHGGKVKKMLPPAVELKRVNL